MTTNVETAMKLRGYAQLLADTDTDRSSIAAGLRALAEEFDTTAPPIETTDPDELLTPAKVVEILADPTINERRVRGWIARGLLRGSHPARGVWFVAPSDLEAWIAGGMRRAVSAPRPRKATPASRIEPGRAPIRSSRSSKLDLN